MVFPNLRHFLKSSKRSGGHLISTSDADTLASRLSPRTIIKDNRGVAAIEFAMIAPIMLGFYFGLSEVSMAIAADRDASHTASVVGDLASQTSELDTQGAADVMTAGLAVLGVNSTELSGVTIELNSFRVNPLTGAKERIGYARLGPPISAGGAADFSPELLSTNLLNGSSGAVVARVNYKYQPVTYAFMNNVTLHETFILKPRKSLSVPFKDGTKDQFSCTAASNLKVSCSSY